jgi:hypothetical protein
MPWWRAEAGSRPACESLSFGSPKERNQRKGDPTGCVPPLCSGQPAVLAGGVRCGTRFALRAPLGQPQRVRPRSLCVLRHTGHPARCAPRRILKGTRSQNIHTGHCFAALRSAALSQREALAPAKAGPSKAMARVAVRLFGCLAVHPLLAAPAAGRLRGGMGVEAPMLRDLTRRGCPSGAAQQQSEFHGAPRNRPAAGLPRSEAQGSQTGGRLFFAYFLLAKQKKVSRRRATPASALPPGMRPNSEPASAPPGVDKAQPEQIARRNASAATPQIHTLPKTTTAAACLPSAGRQNHPTSVKPRGSASPT